MAATSYYSKANLGIGLISTANANLDGSGTVTVCFTAATADSTSNGGSIVSSIKIKSNGTIQDQDMVRLFIFNGSSFFLFKEISVPPTTQSGVLKTFEAVIKLNLKLDAGYQIFASTQYGNSYNIFVNGINYGCSSADSSNLNFPTVQNNFNTGLVTISIANSNINGTGAKGTVLTAITYDASYPNMGTIVNSISVKASETTSQGMVRLYVYDGAVTWLWGEISIPAKTQSGVIKTVEFSYWAGLILNPGYIIYASTQNQEYFNVIANGIDFTCCAIG